MDKYHVDDIVQLTWEHGFQEIGVIEYAAGDPRERVVRLMHDYTIPLRVIAEHEIEFVTNNLGDERVPDWLKPVGV